MAEHNLRLQHERFATDATQIITISSKIIIIVKHLHVAINILTSSEIIIIKNYTSFTHHYAKLI